QDLKDHFRSKGMEVVRADIIKDSATGRSRGCGTVEFRTRADAQRAVAQMQETVLQGRGIFVREDRDSAIRRSSAQRPATASTATGGGSGSGVGMPRRGGPGSRVFVGNLHYDVAWQDLK
ncbi:unnamed protein product, partial [Phaeothamnion confervicola]